MDRIIIVSLVNETFFAFSRLWGKKRENYEITYGAQY